MKHILSFTSALLLFAGCVAAPGHRFSVAKAKTVQVGMTEAEVKSIMENPVKVEVSGEKVMWTYQYYLFPGNKIKFVRFAFQDGKVVEVPLDWSQIKD